MINLFHSHLYKYKVLCMVILIWLIYNVLYIFFEGYRSTLLNPRIPKSGYDKSVELAIYFTSFSFHLHSTENGKFWCGMVLCPHTCPKMYAERKPCFINAALVGGMLSIDLPLQNRSHLHALLVIEFDVRSYKMTVNLSKVAITALT